MKNLITLLLLSIPLSAAADTIRVERAALRGPLPVLRPFATDTVNMKGEKYDIKEALRENATPAMLRSKANGEISHGAPLSTAESGTALNLLQFTLTADRFTQAKVQVKKLKEYKLFANEKEVQDGNLTLTPGLTRIEVLTLTQEAKDTFDISLTGKDLSSLRINDKGKRPYTMADMLLGDHYRAVSLSPTGKYLVTGYYATKEDGTNFFRTVVTETQTEKVILQRYEYTDFKWLADKDILYFINQTEEGRNLISFDPATGTYTVLATALPEGASSISPDGRYIIYNRHQEGKKETNGLQHLQNPDDRQPGWRGRNALYRYDIETKVQQRLTFGSESVWLQDISRDGKKLLLTQTTMRPERSPFDRTCILEMDAYTGKVDTLLNDTTGISSVRYSPDARQLLVKATPFAFGGIGAEVKEGQWPQGFDYRLFLLDPQQNSVRAILPHFKPSVEDFQWISGDGNIYFRATDGCDMSIFRLNPRTLERTKFRLPVSYVQGWTISTLEKRPRFAAFGQTGERAREMFTGLLNAEQPKTQKIGEICFDTLYQGVEIAECRDWDFVSSRGDTIHGFCFLPPRLDPSRKYPVIVYYYGGCTPTTKALEFQYPLSVLAGQGYIVYVCEPSGTIGYGQEFAARHVNAWGQTTADDIIEGTQAFLREHPYADAQKIGCMGASYGGFMTQYLQTRTDIFAAAISHAGISNIASYWGGGYWGYTYGEVAQYGSYPWNNPDLYVRQSPLFNAEKIHTPLLLLHGTADTNVPTNESQQLYTALKILGRPVSYVRVDGENHVITNFNKRLEWQNVIFAWFAHWLKGEPEWWKALYPEDDNAR